MKRTKFSLVVLLGIFFFSGCFVNHYEKNYIPHESGLAQQFPKSHRGDVELAVVTTESGVMQCIEAGYIPLGTASFSEMHCPWYLAIDQAEDVGADLVLLEERYSHTVKRPSVIFLPSYHTTYVSSTWGARSRTVVTTSVSAQIAEIPEEIFQQDALFMRKIGSDSFYGAFLDVPQRLPDEPIDKHITVSVFAVVKGSLAAKAGLKRGQRVVGINGVPITTYKSIEPFLKDLKSIRMVEVSQ